MDKETFSIGYTSKVTALPQSVLRYWETVFPQFCPVKTPGGTRRYTQEDINLVLKIKDLLYTQKFTIAGAKTFLNNELKITVTKSETGLRDYIISELGSILAELNKPIS
jgi:DNA-binding transcriptional MerR regulator